MKVKQFDDKYDKEYVSLLLEINKRIEKLPKPEKLKITSWTKTLSLPTDNIQWKKNRNLYSIMLFDNLLNNRLEPPFNKFANDSNDLPVLSSSTVKSKLSSKFYNEINTTKPNEEIQNFINHYFHLEEESKAIAPTSSSLPHNKQKVLQPTPKTQYNDSDILLNKPYFEFQRKLGNERAFIENEIPQCERMEKYKLESMIQFLQKETVLKDNLIENQSQEIKALERRLNILENKTKQLFK